MANDSKALDEAISEARSHYIQSHPTSAQTFQQATDYMPGGNTRTVLFHGPFPLRIVSGAGCRIKDADGHEYVNLLGEYTAGLFGHNNPVIRRAIDNALDNGVNLSGHNPDEIRLSKLVCERFPSIDKVRFTNSGTEANLLAISLAKYATGRSKVLVFEGGYHGGLLYFRHGGIPINAPFDYVLANFNDVEGCRELIHLHAKDLGCILVEPMQGSSGCIPATPEFLGMLRSESELTGSVLIFDEVMTSRLSESGAQGIYNIVPDMCTLGKYIGGGMTFGAFGGEEELMKLFDPRAENGLPHAGTFNNNSLTMAAGAAAMGEVLTEENLTQLNTRGDRLRDTLNALAGEYRLVLQFTGMGSLLGIHPCGGPIKNSDDLGDEDDRVLELLFLDMLTEGYYFARRGFIALMLTIGEEEIDGFTAAFRRVIENRKSVLPVR